MATETSFREMRTKAAADAVAKEAAKKGHVSVQAPEEGFDQKVEALRREAQRKDKGFAHVEADERETYFAPHETQGKTDEALKRMGAHELQKETLPAFRSARVTERSKAPEKSELDGEQTSVLGPGDPGFDAATQAAQALIGGRPRTGSPVGPEPGQGTKGLPTGQANDYANYQSKYIYNEVDPSGVADAVNADLNLRVNQPEEYGTTDSYEHPDWRGTGWTMHTIESDDVTRYFLENPDTAEAYNLTGHPDAASE